MIAGENLVRQFFQSLKSLAIVCTLMTGSASAQYPGAIKPAEDWSKGFQTITEKQAGKWVTLLAGENFDGRGTGQPGYLKAAFFVAGKLAEYGFEPIGDNGSYFQNLPFTRMVPDPQNSSIELGTLKINGDEIGFTRFSGSGENLAEVVFVKGTGGSARLGDLEAVRGKIVIVAQKNANALMRDLTRARPKSIITVVDDQATIKNASVMNRGGGLRGGGSVTATITTATAKKLAEAAGLKAVVVELGEKDTGAIVKTTDQKLKIQLKVVDQPLRNPNVVGWLEGSDPKLKHEHIIIGAHLDHLGKNERGLFPGADDNASGSTAILQVAKALSANGTRPKRSVLIMWFAAEEMGLIGSRHYANNPIKPLKDCICMLNIDMIGRNEESDDEAASENEDSIHLIGTKKITEDMHKTMLEANKYVGYRFEYDEEDTVFRRSDQASFHDKGIAVAFVFGGFNPYYHQTTDTISGINFSKIANCARLYYASIFLADQHGHYKKKD